MLEEGMNDFRVCASVDYVQPDQFVSTVIFESGNPFAAVNSYFVFDLVERDALEILPHACIESQSIQQFPQGKE